MDEIIDERINYYIRKAAINRIKGYIKCKYNKVFMEYENEVNKYLEIAKSSLLI